MIGLLFALALAVIDGDTFDLDGERIRIANIDAPELHHAKCDAERRLAIVARNRLKALLTSGAINVSVGDPIDGRTRDRRGRTLATISVNGEDIGQILIAEQLARPWEGGQRSWCSAE
jgi:endonuclease YncB( thermonuclease family)